MDLLWLLMVTALVGGFVQGAAGFGFGMVAMAMLALMLDVKEAVPLVSVMGIVVGTSVLIRWRKHLRLINAAPLMAGGLIGIPIGVAFLATMDERILMLALGVVLAGYSATSLIRERRETALREVPIATWWGALAGLAGGVIGGAFNMGGPPVVLYGMLRRWEQGTFVATIQAFFVLMTAFQLGLLVHRGLATSETVAIGALGVPTLLVGVWLGGKVASRLDPAMFRRAVLVLLLLVGVVFLVRGL